MNYKDFYKKEQRLAGISPLSENVDIEKLSPKVRKGIEVELEHTPSKGKKIHEANPKDIAHALKVAKDHWAEDPNYYEKLTQAGLEEEMKVYGGLTSIQPHTALDIPSRMQPVALPRVVSPAACFGVGAVGVSNGQSVGLSATDKEKITAAGETDPSVAQKSVGGSVIPNKGQEQGGPNTKGNIAGTPKGLSAASPGQKGPNTLGSAGGTPKSSQIGQCGCGGKIGGIAPLSMLGQFVEKKEEPTEDEPGMGPEYRVRSDEEEPVGGLGDDTDLNGDEEEQGKDVTISLNESVKNLIKEVIAEVLEEKKGKKKWIQKAINPKHKGYCTPMTKPTCTPRRKALAKRFKKGGDLTKEAVFISRKINEGRELTQYEKDIIKEIVFSKAERMMGQLDDKGWEYSVDHQDEVINSLLEDMVKYRDKDVTAEEIVSSLLVAAEDKLGIKGLNEEDILRKVNELMMKYPARY